MTTAAPTADVAGAVAAILDRMHRMPGALLPILHEIQHVIGHIPAEAVPLVARALNLSRAEVHGVISFYHDFHTAPRGRHRVQICRAEACQAVGARELEQHALAKLGIGYGETSADGNLSLDPVYCFGNCACGPTVQIDDELHALVTPLKFDGLLAGVIAAGPATDPAANEAAK